MEDDDDGASDEEEAAVATVPFLSCIFGFGLVWSFLRATCSCSSGVISLVSDPGSPGSRFFGSVRTAGTTDARNDLKGLNYLHEF